jgi:hypothetical protein
MPDYIMLPTKIIGADLATGALPYFMFIFKTQTTNGFEQC